VRVGNAAVNQFQLDVYGEVMDTLHLGRHIGLESDEAAWGLPAGPARLLESKWREPDEGIWEIRGPRRHFTHSKVMAWVALDRAIKEVELTGLEGPGTAGGPSAASSTTRSAALGRSTSPPPSVTTPATPPDPSPASGSHLDEPDITRERRSPA
jgi:Glycosyl hydrolases family 15